MKNSMKIIGGFLLAWLISFVFIFLFVFFGGHKLFEADSPVLWEIGISFIVGAILYYVCSMFKNNNDKIDELEKRIEKLENDKELIK